MDPGEGADETCVREVREETGLDVRVTRLVGVYTSPDIMVEYADGNRIQPVAFSFEAEVIGGELGLSDETTEYGYVAIDELDTVDLMEPHRQRYRRCHPESGGGVLQIGWEAVPVPFGQSLNMNRRTRLGRGPQGSLEAAPVGAILEVIHH